MPPTATYRLQLRREFTFDDAAAVVPYLARLGVSHVYCSPVLQAAPGSPHGYDVIDHSRLSSDLGGDEGWRRLVAACRDHELRLVVDVVPNHMAMPEPVKLNAQLWDVLMHGPDSPYAGWFDVDWDAQDGRILLPVLGAPAAQCLERGELALVDGELAYFDQRFPVAPGTEHLAGDLAELLAAQRYRLVHWRVGSEELNYRRFFDVTTLLGVRVEKADVFEQTHRRILQLVAAGEVDGLRIDHPDGLADPGGYLEELARRTGRCWTLVEKILEHGEVLPAGWATDGSTGYDAIAAVTQVLTDPAGAAPLTEIYAAVTGADTDFDAVVEAAKRDVLARSFPAELSRLLRELAGARDDHAARDFTDGALRDALTELLVAFEVYRAYPGVPASEEHIASALKHATERRPDLHTELAWLGSLLDATAGPAAGFAVRFAQTTGPVMAKGVEDTAFYRYHRLVALNEVGGNPGQVGSTVSEWHAHCERLARDWPRAMTTSTTHDTKRSEDVRARLLVLAEIPDEWHTAVSRWRDAARRHDPPDAPTDYLFWQTLVGAWPIDAERLAAYLEKASREAKQHTSWTDPDPAYDEALRSYVHNVRGDADLMADVETWLDAFLTTPARSNVLAQKLLQLTMPGIPDVYQGQELPDLSLVDPDNRRPVDYARRQAALDMLDAGADVDPKLRVTARALRLRRKHPEAFAGTYAPLDAVGPARDHVVAFARGADVVTVATRLPVGLARAGGWGETSLALPEGDWQDALTGRPASTRLRDLLADLPVALLVAAGRRGAA